MPFVTQEHRDKPDPLIPGDRCYLWYRWMMDEWAKSRRWTTADRIYQQVRVKEGDHFQQIAKELAWQVFFILQVMPYEEEKEEENGTIE